MLLLDTQVVVWVMEDNARLGPSTRGLIDTSTAVHVSAATVWELTIKSMLGKITVPDDLTSALPANGMMLLPIETSDAEAIRQFPELVRHDPFDRILLAQSKAAGLTFVTADRTLLDLGYDWTRDARR